MYLRVKVVSDPDDLRDVGSPLDGVFEIFGCFDTFGESRLEDPLFKSHFDPVQLDSSIKGTCSKTVFLDSRYTRMENEECTFC